MIARALAVVRDFFAPVEFEIVDAYCMKCGAHYDADTEHTCPAFVVELVCMNCDALQHGDLHGRCSHCGSENTADQRIEFIEYRSDKELAELKRMLDEARKN